MHKTTLILGAGASYDYGYPLGSKLIQDMHKIRFHNIFSDKIHPNEWRKRLRETQPPSIDYFMSLDNTLMESMKPYMYLYLLAKESDSATLSLDYTNNWYYHFFSEKITSNIEATKRNLKKINVITFNYDRSFEYYLSRMIKQRCFHNDTTYFNAFELMRTMEIHHVYGRLPELPNETKADSPGVQYGAVRESQLTGLSAASHYGIANGENLFQICYEPVNENIKIKNRDLLNQSHNAVFLGFGFHKENVQILGYDLNRHMDRMFSTGVMSNSKRNEVSSLFPKMEIQEHDNCGMVDRYKTFLETI